MDIPEEIKETFVLARRPSMAKIQSTGVQKTSLGLWISNSSPAWCLANHHLELREMSKSHLYIFFQNFFLKKISLCTPKLLSASLLAKCKMRRLLSPPPFAPPPIPWTCWGQCTPCHPCGWLCLPSVDDYPSLSGQNLEHRFLSLRPQIVWGQGN